MIDFCISSIAVEKQTSSICLSDWMSGTGGPPLIRFGGLMAWHRQAHTTREFEAEFVCPMVFVGGGEEL